MSFIDKVKITVIAGNGGNGKLNFLHEKFVDKGGPDGGDGGNGANVVLTASRNQNTLVAFRYQKEVRAKDGNPGGKTRMHGRSAKHLIVPVPVGTVVTNEAGEILADLAVDGQEHIIAKGGRGGFGNAHFVSSRRQAPNFAEKGEPGEELDIQLEMKMIADVGLVGLPNAGKSTFLSKVSNARPEIANYAFTTLTPNLGVADIGGDTSVLFADIPGLIEGAADGKGLGHDFLRHIERTAAVLHLVDAYNDDVAQVYTVVKAELEAYQPDMITRPEIIALTKIEGLDDEIVDDLKQQLAAVAPKGTQIFGISSASGAGVKELLFAVKDIVINARSVVAEAEEVASSALPVIRLTDTSDAYQVVKDEDDIFYITGQRVEMFGKRTDFENEEGVQRLRDIMRRQGVLHELVRQGIEPGQIIQIGSSPERRFTY